MKTLYLLRHGKSSWGNPDIEDFQRPLKKRGLAAAHLVGHFMHTANMRPDLVLCSPATRAHQTLSSFLVGFSCELEHKFDKALYHATADVIVRQLCSVPKAINAIMVIGHNPGLQTLALRLTRNKGNKWRALENKFPTAALAILTCKQSDWSSLLPGSFKLQGFITPKTLIE